MDEKLLIELLEGLTGPQNVNGQVRNALLERCLKASGLELKEFFDELSQLLRESPDVYLPTLQTFISHLREEYSRATRRRNLQNTALPNFISMLISVVIMKNLRCSDIPGFGELIYDCVELLWQCRDDKPASSTGNKVNSQIKLTTKKLFTEILNTEGVFGVLISETSGRRCLKRVLFNYNLYSEIDQRELLNAVDVVGDLLENCSDHKDVPSKLLKEFSVYKACAALSETLKCYKNSLNVGRNSLPLPSLYDMVILGDEPINNNLNNRKRSSSNTDDSTPLSANDEPHLALLNLVAPRKSELPKFLRDLEQLKTNSLKDLIEFLPCESCHKRALVHLSPDKYSSLMEEGGSTDVGSEFKPNYRLPFEFNDSDGLGPWDILLSEDAVKDMLNLESPLKTKAVMKKLDHISSGLWDKHGLRRRVLTNDIPIYEDELNSDGLKIIWQVDYGFSIRNLSLTQLVKVWSITAKQEDIDKTENNLMDVCKVYAPEQYHRYAVSRTRDGIILPKFFEDEEGTKSSNDMLHCFDVDNEKLLEVHKMLVTNKFIPLSKNLFKSLVMGGSGFTFNVSKIEYEIINNPTSAIIIGRSGTGKTTCIAFRLVASYLNNKIHKAPSLLVNNGNSYKRQMFITVSFNLCRRVKEYFNKLRESAEIAGKNMTKADFEQFAKRREGGGEGIDEDEDDKLLEEGDEDRELGDIPNSFRQLTDDHFPLFITYEKFSKMLQGTYGIDSKKITTQKKFDTDDDDAHDEEGEEFHTKSSASTSDASWFHFVDFDLFYSKYWLHFNDYYRKKLDCGLVYSEFFVIKGTYADVDCLSRKEYKEISIKKFPVFRYNRDEIYDLFERYEKMKAKNYDYDSVDLTLAILRAAKKKALRGPRIHEVYIDECQDNQIVDLALILKLFDHADNVFMAGDIAQCINRGSSFRFQNLRELMYNWERDRSQNNNNSRDALEPKQFELDVNYRSHNGILQIAASVIELIRKFFPDSIDHLKRERSEVGGPRPIFFKGFQAETFLFDVFSVNEKFADCIEFGAEQVIIVRDDDARKRVGKVGIVMTVFEAKGMEFNDVLLYNFFTDSPAKQKWRLILSALDDHSRGLQAFSHEKHYILSSELKHLYVAVTRARQHLWIFDEDAELSDPIRIFWERDNLVKVVQTLEEIGSLPTLIKKSSSHEWNKKGKMFFERRQYELAIFCFKNGGNEESQKLAEAYNLQQIARASFVNNSDEARTNFKTAARAFEKCSRPNQAATCYQDIGMHKEAGDVYVRWCIFDFAANCYLKAKMWDKAGECFKKKGMYTEAVIAYKDGGSYKKVIDLMQKHREEIDEKIFRRITRLINIHYRRENDKEMSKEALSILPTQEEQIELLRDHAPEELLEVCEKFGKFRDAAKDLYSRGKFKEAADMFIRSDDEEDIIEALQCLLYLCSTNVMKNIMTATMRPDVLQELKNLHYKAEEIVTKVKSQLSKTLKRSDRWINMMEEFQLYIAYLNSDIEGIHKCIQYFKLNGEIPTEFRAINMWLQFIPPFDNEAQIAEYWQERLQYLLRLCDLAFPYIRIVTTRPQNSKEIMKIYKDFEDIFFVRRVENRPSKRKLFFEHPLVDRIQNKEDSVDNWHFYDINYVRNAILYFLAPYIFDLISDANQKCRELPYISSEICHKFESCPKPDCKYHHVVPNPSILKQRLTLACLHYSLIQQWELLYHRRLLEEEQSKRVRPTQRRCAESLIKIHFRYQSPQASCPEVTRMMIARLPKPAHKGIIDLANKIWLKSLSENHDDFAAMLKCMLILQQLWDGNDWSINAFGWTMSKVIRLSYFDTLPLGFTYYGYHQNQAIPIGTRLSLFFSLLYSNRVIKAITEMKRFLNYTIDHASLVKMDTSDAFSDLVFLIEFRLSLIFAVGPGYCDFCLPRSYLVNYFDTFTPDPLVSRYRYKRENYWVEIKYSLEQIKRLLDHLIYDERYYLTIILRLIRLLVIIGRNEFNLASRVLGIFKDLLKDVYSMKIKKYLEEKNMLNLVKILRDDLQETDCDSLVIVHYHWGGVSRFSELEKSGVPMIKYKSIEGFRSSLRKIISPVATEENAETDVAENQLLPQRKQNTDLAFAVEDDDEDDDDEQAVSKEDSETKSQTWFRQIQDSDEAHEAAERIQDWFRRTYERRQVSSQHAHDRILDKVYSDVKDFCCNVSFWEVTTSQKGEKAVRKYKILLRGLMVDLVVELTKLQDKMDNIKNKLKKKINNRSTDDEKLEICLELEDDLKHIHYENVKMTLESLSITENSTMHREADIKRLESEMQQANSFIDLVEEWMLKCVDAMK